MDKLTHAAVAFLKSKRGVSNVVFQTKIGVSELEIAKWEDQNLPYDLPEDYKTFLRISNGMRLTWCLDFRGKQVRLGDMCLNQLDRVESIVANVSPSDDPEPLDAFLNDGTKAPVSVAFSIDSQCRCGKVALVYSSRETRQPQVWFQDLSGRWNFLASTFIEYFRMMVVHLGLPNWQYRFTRYGLDPVSKQWFRLISPERLVIDLNAQSARVTAKEKMYAKSGGSKASSSSPAASSGTSGKQGSSMDGPGVRSARGSGSRERLLSSRRGKKSTARDIYGGRAAERIRPRSAF